MNYSHMSVEVDSKNQKNCNLAQLIDATLLNPKALKSEYLILFEQAAFYEFRAVCVPPIWVGLAKSTLGAGVKVCTVVGFPMGYGSLVAKLAEVSQCFNAGADEIDYVQNPRAAAENDLETLYQETRSICQEAQKVGEKVTKVILETSLLSQSQIQACALVHARAGISYVKTSTGYGSRGATIEDIECIQKGLRTYEMESKKIVGIKASGGIRTQQDALNFVKMGVHRLGTSQGVAIVTGSENIKETNY